jgi:hypothetical protein
VSNAILKTFMGIDFDLLEPMPEMVDIRDIAHALGNLCRFNGHCRRHYSVAQHSVIVSEVAQPWDAMRGLLHDAAEAYVGYITTPLKALLPDFQAIENRIQQVIFEVFGVGPDVAAGLRIAKIDSGCVIAAECRDLHPSIVLDRDPMKDVIRPKTLPWMGEIAFLSRFLKLQTAPGKTHHDLQVHTESLIGNYLTDPHESPN